MLFPAMPAVILLQKQNILSPAARAGYSIRPAPCDQIFTAINGIGEVEDRFLEGFRFACHASTIGENGYFVNYIIAQKRVALLIVPGWSLGFPNPIR